MHEDVEKTVGPIVGGAIAVGHVRRLRMQQQTMCGGSMEIKRLGESGHDVEIHEAPRCTPFVTGLAGGGAISIREERKRYPWG